MPCARLVDPEPGVEALHPRAHVATVAAHAPSRKSRRDVLSVMPFPPKGDAGVDPKTIRKRLPMPNNLKSLWRAGVVVGNQNQRAIWTLESHDQDLAIGSGIDGLWACRTPSPHSFPPCGGAEFHSSVTIESGGKATSASQADGKRTRTVLSGPALVNTIA